MQACMTPQLATGRTTSSVLATADEKRVYLPHLCKLIQVQQNYWLTCDRLVGGENEFVDSSRMNACPRVTCEIG